MIQLNVDSHYRIFTILIEISSSRCSVSEDTLCKGKIAVQEEMDLLVDPKAYLCELTQMIDCRQRWKSSQAVDETSQEKG